MQINFDQIRDDIKSGYYKRIGVGSGRQVFDLKNGYVVKVAGNKKGMAQNRVEYYIAMNYPSDILARVLMISDNDQFLIMQKAEKVKNISDIWSYYNIKTSQQLFEIKEIKELITQFHLLPADLVRPVNWGKIKKRPVIIDYGFTEKVREKYY